jgi:hypothetical protein
MPADQNKTMKGSQMQTPVEVEGLLASPQPLEAAANEEFAGHPVPPSGGWDPYEVWRTRVKATKQGDESDATIV